MFKLPENKPQVPRDTPRNYFIYGETMSGKSYLANEFPNPIVLNTDGNASANSVPAIQLINARDRSGRITKSVIDQLSEILLALQTQEHTYETVVVDVIDDVIDMIKIAVCSQFGVKSLSEISYGKGYDYFNQALTELVIDLKALPMNVIYISREIEITDDGTGVTHYEPSLKTKFFNIVNGNCDVVVRTRKIGDGKNASYFREVKSLRTMYKPENITDKRVLQLLESCSGMFSKEELAKLKQEKQAAKVVAAKKSEITK